MLSAYLKKPFVWILLGGILIGALIIYYYNNPLSGAWFPQCPVKLLTGYSCPGCGVQRAFHALLHGNLGQALAYNYFFVLSVPYFILACIALILRGRFSNFERIVEGKTLAMIYVVCYFVWFVVRNVLEI
ncbi:MAG: DUF2752 domain-containing protein [Muribaculaceae bacterium]|nr:DUF2752 domain-containing protein [Muribaculaceae bacterium]